MNLRAVSLLAKPAIAVAGKIKQFVWSDGVFKPKRALALAGLLVIIIFGIYLIGAENMVIAVDLLDDVSDSIGYAE